MFRKSLRSAMLAGFACLLVMFVACGVTACSGQGDEQVIRSGISAELDTFKNPTKESLSKVIGENDSSIEEIKSYGVDPYEFLAHCFKSFDYKIGDIKVSNGNEATANVSVTNVDISKAMQKTSERADSADGTAKLAEVYAAEGQNGALRQFFTWFYECIDAETSTVTTDVSIKATKTSDGKWELDDSSLDALVSAAYGGADFASM
ncbi:MAG: hypothetical protein J6D54_03655 [Olsenella sp.]|nr:hypothetical protein [Olsenella sp.]